MALDHYVPQTYLKHWYAPDRQLLNVIRKSDLRNHVARTKDVCRIFLPVVLAITKQ
jgi:hypothetical protein